MHDATVRESLPAAAYARSSASVSVRTTGGDASLSPPSDTTAKVVTLLESMW